MFANYAGGALNPVTLDAVTTDVEVVNTVTATAVYTYTLAGNSLSTNNIARLTIWGDYLNDSGGTPNLTLDLRYSSTTLATATFTLSATSTRRPMHILAYIKGDAATNAQRGQFTGWSPPAASTGGSTYGGQGTGAVDSTANADITFRVTHGTAASTISFILRAAWLELIRNL